MNIEEAKERCKKFTPVVYIEHPEIFGSEWQVEQDIKSIEAVKVVLSELEYKQDDINVLQAQRDSVENQLKQAKAELEKKNEIINEMAKYLATVVDCPYENKGIDMECESKCDFGRDEECWKEYFTKKVEDK